MLHFFHGYKMQEALFNVGFTCEFHNKGIYLIRCNCVCVCMRACVRACVRASMHVWVYTISRRRICFVSEDLHNFIYCAWIHSIFRKVVINAGLDRVPCSRIPESQPGDHCALLAPDDIPLDHAVSVLIHDVSVLIHVVGVLITPCIARTKSQIVISGETTSRCP